MSVAAEMDRILDALDRLRVDGGTGALATLVHTRGSTFRRAGAAMLVRPDGDLVCALSGGCPQRDIVHRALEVLREGRAQRVRYDREHGLDVMMEMGCEGHLEVLIEPLDGARMLEWVPAVRSWRAERREGFLATAFAGPDGTPYPVPRRLLWSGTVRHDALDDPMLRHHLESRLPKLPMQARVLELPGTTGPMQVLLQALRPRHRLAVIGSGAGAQALARAGLQLGWQVLLVDVDARVLARCEAPQAVQRLLATPEHIVPRLAPDRYTSVVVMTHHLLRDTDYLQALKHAPMAYLGALGSRQRAARLRAATGLDAERLHAPAGLDIGSETPDEIALAVSAEILAHLHRREGRSLSRHEGPIHTA